MKEITLYRKDFSFVQDGSGDTFFDELLDTLDISRDDEIEEVNLEIASHSFC